MSNGTSTVESDLISNLSFYKPNWTIHLKFEITSDIVSSMSLFYQVYYDALQKDPDLPTPRMLVSSTGGDLFCTFGIIDLMHHWKKKHNISLDVDVIGAAFSGASIIAVAGTGKRRIGKNSYVMIHDIYGIAEQQIKATDVQKRTIYITELQDRYLRFFTDYSKLELATLKENLRDDVFYNADECIKNGLIDEILE